MKDIGIYVTLFAIGHSTTMLFGVLTGISANAYVIDAIIGLSVVYKALDNLGAYQRWFGFQPNTKVATLVFGFFHGFGLATKIIEFQIAEDGLLTNLIAFNIGVELGQLLALDAVQHGERVDDGQRHLTLVDVGAPRLAHRSLTGQIQHVVD